MAFLPEFAGTQGSKTASAASFHHSYCLVADWGIESSEDKSFQVFISPVLKDSIEVGGCLVHELVHAAVGIECRHRGGLPAVARPSASKAK